MMGVIDIEVLLGYINLYINQKDMKPWILILIPLLFGFNCLFGQDFRLLVNSEYPLIYSFNREIESTDYQSIKSIMFTNKINYLSSNQIYHESTLASRASRVRSMRIGAGVGFIIGAFIGLSVQVTDDGVYSGLERGENLALGATIGLISGGLIGLASGSEKEDETKF